MWARFDWAKISWHLVSLSAVSLQLALCHGKSARLVLDNGWSPSHIPTNLLLEPNTVTYFLWGKCIPAPSNCKWVTELACWSTKMKAHFISFITAWIWGWHLITFHQRPSCQQCQFRTKCEFGCASLCHPTPIETRDLCICHHLVLPLSDTAREHKIFLGVLDTEHFIVLCVLVPFGNIIYVSNSI